MQTWSEMLQVFLISNQSNYDILCLFLFVNGRDDLQRRVKTRSVCYWVGDSETFSPSYPFHIFQRRLLHLKQQSGNWYSLWRIFNRTSYLIGCREVQATNQERPKASVKEKSDF